MLKNANTIKSDMKSVGIWRERCSGAWNARYYFWHVRWFLHFRCCLCIKWVVKISWTAWKTGKCLTLFVCQPFLITSFGFISHCNSTTQWRWVFGNEKSWAPNKTLFGSSSFRSEAKTKSKKETKNPGKKLSLITANLKIYKMTNAYRTDHVSRSALKSECFDYE